MYLSCEFNKRPNAQIIHIKLLFKNMVITEYLIKYKTVLSVVSTFTLSKNYFLNMFCYFFVYNNNNNNNNNKR